MTTTRTWPYGTRKNVTVINSGLARAGRVVLARETGTCEVFILVQGLEVWSPATDCEGVIVFSEGGPTGGYWRFEVPA